MEKERILDFTELPTPKKHASRRQSAFHAFRSVVAGMPPQMETSAGGLQRQGSMSDLGRTKGLASHPARKIQPNGLDMSSRQNSLRNELVMLSKLEGDGEDEVDDDDAVITTKAVRGAWSFSLSGGCPLHDTWSDNPQILLLPSKKGSFDIELRYCSPSPPPTSPLPAHHLPPLSSSIFDCRMLRQRSHAEEGQEGSVQVQVRHLPDEYSRAMPAVRPTSERLPHRAPVARAIRSFKHAAMAARLSGLSSARNSRASDSSQTRAQARFAAAGRASIIANKFREASENAEGGSSVAPVEPAASTGRFGSIGKAAKLISALRPRCSREQGSDKPSTAGSPPPKPGSHMAGSHEHEARTLHKHETALKDALHASDLEMQAIDAIHAVGAGATEALHKMEHGVLDAAHALHLDHATASMTRATSNLAHTLHTLEEVEKFEKTEIGFIVVRFQTTLLRSSAPSPKVAIPPSRVRITRCILAICTPAPLTAFFSPPCLNARQLLLVASTLHPTGAPPL